MNKNHGFSLAEVLVSLLLLSTVFLTLLKQQWQLSRLFNQLTTRNMALLHSDNRNEQISDE